METVNVTVHMERQTRDDAAKLFSELGISTTQAINMFLKQAVRERGDPLRGDRKARRRARRREAWVRKSGASPSPTGRRRPSGDLICYLQNLSFRQAKLDARGMGPFSAGGSRGSPHGPHVRETPAPPRAQFSSNAPQRKRAARRAGQSAARRPCARRSRRHGARRQGRGIS